MIAALFVAIISFFELCFTGRAVCSMRLARTGHCLTSHAGATSTNSPKPRCNHSIFIKRKVSLGMYSAMLIFLVFCITTFVSCPDGRTHLMEDGNSSLRIAGQSAAPTATEGPSSTPDKTAKFIVLGCVTFLYLIIFCLVIRGRIALRKESRYGK